MTVSELITDLQKHDPNLEIMVCVRIPDGGVDYVSIHDITFDEPVIDDIQKNIMAINV